MRTPELNPLMLDPEQCRAYNIYASNPVQLLEYVQVYKKLINVSHGTVIDLGSGSCNFVIALAQHYPELNFVCYEGSDAMVEIARENINTLNLSSRIKVIKDDILNATGEYDVVLANRLLHHVDNTLAFWKIVNQLSDNILVIDINRPPTKVVEHIREVDEYQEPLYKEDLLSSMQAAYSLEEVTEQIKEYNYSIFADEYYRLFVYHTK